jgi:DNA-binding transcriptional ArsR family regulator
MTPILRLDKTLLALAHPARRAISSVCLKERRVTAQAEPFAMSLNAVSKHIHVLERARLVRRRRAGREHLLPVNPAPRDAHAPDEHGVVSEPNTFRIERILPGPIERAWAYLTEPEKRRKWFVGGPMDCEWVGACHYNSVFRSSRRKKRRQIKTTHARFPGG